MAPDRHGPQLAAMAKSQPRYAAAIKEAGELLRAERRQAKTAPV